MVVDCEEDRSQDLVHPLDVSHVGVEFGVDEEDS